MQYVLKLPTEGVVGPQRENLSYMKANQHMEKIKSLEQHGTLQELQAELQEEINQCYGAWRNLAVREALEVADIVPATVPDKLRATAGAEVTVRWVVPRRAIKRGRKQQASWAAGCQWLGTRAQEMANLLWRIENGMQQMFLKPLEKEKWKKQINSLKEHMESMSKRTKTTRPLPPGK